MYNGGGVTRIPDLCSMFSSSCYGSPNVFTNSLNTERFSDLRCCFGVHIGKHNVYANKLDVQVCTDLNTCVSIDVQCSPNVFVNLYQDTDESREKEDSK